jgi:sporulation-control protein
MILRKYMSLLGIGSATIDLKLDHTKFQPGECVTGHFHIQGGTIEQQLKRIECDLVMKNEEENKEVIIESSTIYTTQMIESQEQNQLNFRFTLPDKLEKSSSTIKYRFKTKMIFDAGVKSEDQDLIHIQ